MYRAPSSSILSVIFYAVLALVPTAAMATLTVTTEVGPTWPAGSVKNGANSVQFVAQSADPLGPFNEIPVMYLGSSNGGGTEILLNTSLRFRFRLDYTDPMRLDSILVGGAGDDRASAQIRLLDQNRGLIASQPLSGLINVYSTTTLNAGSPQGQSFFLELWDASLGYRYVDRIEIHASVVPEPSSLVLAGCALAVVTLTALVTLVRRRRRAACTNC